MGRGKGEVRLGLILLLAVGARPPKAVIGGAGELQL